jgi:hypothetical protein
MPGPSKKSRRISRQTVRSVGMSGTIAGMRLGTSVADEMREQYRRRVLDVLEKRGNLLRMACDGPGANTKLDSLCLTLPDDARRRHRCRRLRPWGIAGDQPF